MTTTHLRPFSTDFDTCTARPGQLLPSAGASRAARASTRPLAVAVAVACNVLLIAVAAALCIVFPVLCVRRRHREECASGA